MSSLDNTKNVLQGNINSEYLNFKNRIIQSLNIHSNDHLYSKFVDKFLSYIPEDYIYDYQVQDFITLSQKSFDFFKKEHLQFPNIEIESEKDRNTIFILNRNMPFIVDSITSLLQENNINYALILHPVLFCTRDNNGLLDTINDVGDDNDSESLVVIQINSALSHESQQDLRSKIIKLLDIIIITCNSFDPILQKIELNYSTYTAAMFLVFNCQQHQKLQDL